MRDRDSSATRVKPVFDALRARDPGGTSWLPTLLKLPEPGVNSPVREPVGPLSDLEDAAWDPAERSLMPPRVLLQWLVCCASPGGRKDDTAPATHQKREALFQRDPEIVGEALALLSRPNLPSKAWYILEGASQPDVYLQTGEAVVVIEGKRTEKGPTIGTSWMPGRHQMLRHLDCAWESRGLRRVFGFFIVEGDGGAEAVSVPVQWVDASAATITPAALRASLPHRTVEERAAIARCFLGVTTWQRVCKELEIDWGTLPDRRR